MGSDHQGQGSRCLDIIVDHLQQGQDTLHDG